MAYSYDPIFAADPSNAANVAANASIIIFDPNDPGKAPVTITDVTGSPLPNPITVNKNGFGPAFQHATLDRVGWFGAGFTGYFTSYEGMRAEAVAAKEAAQEAAVTAGVDAAAVATAAIGTATSASTAAAASAATAASNASASATAAANAAALVAAPADSAIAAAINGTGATKTALTSAIAGKLDTADAEDFYVNRARASFGVGASGASERNPFQSMQELKGVSPGTTDKVAHGITSIVTGDFSNDPAPNGEFAWGVNMFTVTGKVAGDAHGANIQNLAETAIAAPAGSTIATAIGLMSDCAFFGSTAGAHVNIMISHRVGAPRRKDGALAGTAGIAYGLFVEHVTPANTGAASGFSVFVEGGISRFGGRVDVNGQICNYGTGNLELMAGLNSSEGGKLNLLKGGGAQLIQSAVGAAFFLNNGSSNTHTFYNDGRTALGSSSDFANAVGVSTFIKDVTTAPNRAVTGGVVQYSQAGVAKFRQGDGSIINFAKLAAIPSPTADVASLKTAVDAVRAALIDLGKITA